MYQDPELLDLLERAKLLKQSRPKNVSPYHTPQLPRGILQLQPKSESPQMSQQLHMLLEQYNATLQQQNLKMYQIYQEFSDLQTDYDLLKQKYVQQLKDSADVGASVSALVTYVTTLEVEVLAQSYQLDQVYRDKCKLEETCYQSDFQGNQEIIGNLEYRIAQISAQNAYDSEQRARQQLAWYSEIEIMRRYLGENYVTLESKATEIEALKQKCQHLTQENAVYARSLKSDGLALSCDVSRKDNGEISQLKSEIDALEDLEKPEVSDFGPEYLKLQLKDSKIKHIDLQVQYQELYAKYIGLMLGKIQPDQNIEDIMRVYEIVMQEMDNLKAYFYDICQADYRSLLERKDSQIYQLMEYLKTNNEALRDRDAGVAELYRYIDEYDIRLAHISSVFVELQEKYKYAIADNKNLAIAAREYKTQAEHAARLDEVFESLLMYFRKEGLLTDAVGVDADWLCQAISELLYESKRSYKAINAVADLHYAADALKIAYQRDAKELEALKHEIADMNIKKQNMQTQNDMLCKDNEALAVLIKNGETAVNELQSNLSTIESYLATLCGAQYTEDSYFDAERALRFLGERISAFEVAENERECVSQLVKEQYATIAAQQDNVSNLSRQLEEYDGYLQQLTTVAYENERLSKKIAELYDGMQEIRQMDEQRLQLTTLYDQYVEQLASLYDYKAAVIAYNSKLSAYLLQDKALISELQTEVAKIKGCILLPRELATQYPFSEIVTDGAVNAVRLTAFSDEIDRTKCEVNRLKADIGDFYAAYLLSTERIEALQRYSQQNGSQVCERPIESCYSETQTESLAADSLHAKSATKADDDLMKENQTLRSKVDECRYFCKEVNRSLSDNILLPARFLQTKLFYQSSPDYQLDVYLLEDNLEYLMLVVDKQADTKFVVDEYKRQVSEYRYLIESNVYQLCEAKQQLYRFTTDIEAFKKREAELNSQILACKEEISNFVFEKQELLQEVGLANRANADLKEKAEQLVLQASKINVEKTELVTQKNELEARLYEGQQAFAIRSEIISALYNELGIENQYLLCGAVYDLKAHAAYLPARDFEVEKLRAEISALKLPVHDVYSQSIQTENQFVDQYGIIYYLAGVTTYLLDFYPLVEQRVVSKLAQISEQCQNQQERLHKASLALRELYVLNDQLSSQVQQLTKENSEKGKALSEWAAKFVEVQARIERLQLEESGGTMLKPPDKQQEPQRSYQRNYKPSSDYLRLPTRFLAMYPFENCVVHGEIDADALENVIREDNKQLLYYLDTQQQYVSQLAQKDTKISNLRQENHELRGLLAKFDEVLYKNQVISADLLASHPFVDGLRNGVFDANKFVANYQAQISEMQRLRTENEQLRQLTALQNEKQEADLLFSKSYLADSQLKLSVLERENHELRKSKFAKPYSYVGESVKFSSGGEIDGPALADLEMHALK